MLFQILFFILKGGTMTSNYTLRELSEDLDISINDLRSHIRQGKLKAKKTGRGYSIEDADLDDFVASQIPLRNYLCQNYNRCLDRSARANTVLDCELCPKYIRADAYFDGDAFPLRPSAYTSSISIQ